MKECVRCLLNDGVPGLSFDSNGECSACSKYDREWGDWEERKDTQQAKLDEMLNAARLTHRPYQALVPLSGGKDSTYVLYLARVKYGLRCLAVTYDNGFLSEYARKNIRTAVDALEVDHVFLRHSWPHMQQLYRTFFLKTGLFCVACMRGITVAMDMAAASYKIPLVFQGSCHRTEEYVSDRYFVPGAPDFFDAVIEGEPFEKTTPLAYRGDPTRRLMAHTVSPKVQERLFYGVIINLPDYVDWDYDQIFSAITNKLGWRAPEMDAEHVDCDMESVMTYIRQRKFPALIPGLTRFSKLVTIGKITKEQARARLTNPELVEPSNLARFLENLNITREEFERVVSDPTRHLRYLEQANNSWRTKARGAAGQIKKVVGLRK